MSSAIGQLIPAFTITGEPGTTMAAPGVPVGAIAVGQLIPGVVIELGGGVLIVTNVNFDFSSADSSATLGFF